ncbi:MAG: tyrosine-type recombinase/integrase [Candidatus Eisenbacteria bacterium]
MRKHKCMLAWVEEYVTYRRNLGFRFRTDREQLLHFAKYVTDNRHRGPLTTDLALRWVQLAQDGSPSYRRRRFETVRSFAKYLAIYEPRTEIPPRGILRLACHRPEPYIYSEQKIADLVRACGELTPSGGLRPRTYSTLFALLAATGLRVSEALKLDRNHVDLVQGVLTVRETKFRKSRLVPFHPSIRQALLQYADFRDCYHPIPKSGAFFLSESGRSLPYPTVSYVFQKLRQRLGWRCENGRRHPRIHDLRHSFACRRILSWYKEGKDVDRLIPFLSAYLGHAKVTDTYWYLTGIPELFAITTERFEQYAQSKIGETP